LSIHSIFQTQLELCREIRKLKVKRSTKKTQIIERDGAYNAGRIAATNAGAEIWVHHCSRRIGLFYLSAEQSIQREITSQARGAIAEYELQFVGNDIWRVPRRGKSLEPNHQLLISRKRMSFECGSHWRLQEVAAF
jgi:hypothetical protein